MRPSAWRAGMPVSHVVGRGVRAGVSMGRQKRGTHLRVAPSPPPPLLSPSYPLLKKKRPSFYFFTHTVCSACVRGSLEFQASSGTRPPRCPHCRAPADPGDLRRAPALAAAVSAHRAARAAVAAAFVAAAAERAAAAATAAAATARRGARRPRPVEEESGEEEAEEGGGGHQGGGSGAARRRAPLRRAAAAAAATRPAACDDAESPSPSSPLSPAWEEGGGGGSGASPDRRRKHRESGGGAPPPPSLPPPAAGPPRGTVACPACGCPVGTGLINAHLDSCLARGAGGGGGWPAAPPPPPALPTLLPFRGAAHAPAAARRPLPVPPKLIMAIVKDKELRDRLRGFGLPTAGKRTASLGRGEEGK